MLTTSELAELRRLAPAPGKQPSKRITNHTIELQIFGYVEQLNDRTWRLTNKGMNVKTRQRIEELIN